MDANGTIKTSGDIKDVASFFCVSIWTVREWMDEGKLGFFKCGRAVRFLPAEVGHFAANHTTTKIPNLCRSGLAPFFERLFSDCINGRQSADAPVRLADILAATKPVDEKLDSLSEKIRRLELRLGRQVGIAA